MELSRELLAAIGEVVLEVTKLEYVVAEFVAARWAWDADLELAIVARAGCARDQLAKLVVADPGWSAARSLHQNVEAVLDARNKLVHSSVVYVMDDDDQGRGIELWHTKSRTAVTLPPVRAVEELVSDIGSCVVTTFMSVPSAKERFQALGGAVAPQPPRPPS